VNDSEFTQERFEAWVEDWFRVYDPADFAYYELMAERLVEEMRAAGWRPIRVAGRDG
jgi:hypothetical protein